MNPLDVIVIPYRTPIAFLFFPWIRIKAEC